MKNLVLSHIDADRKQEGSDRLLAFADSMLRVDGQISGGRIQSGSIEVGLIPFDLFSQYQSFGKANEQLQEMLICVPPKAKLKDPKALSILANQLTLP